MVCIYFNSVLQSTKSKQKKSVTLDTVECKYVSGFGIARSTDNDEMFVWTSSFNGVY